MKPKSKKVVESEARRVRRRTSIQHVLLHTIAAAGILSVALLAPNALQVLKMFDGGKARRMNPKYLFSSAFDRMLMKGLIRIDRTTKGSFARLTDAGKNELAKYVARHPDTRRHGRWDGRWRMVIYDIREQRRATREQLKELLRAFGFYRLQHSVWVYPYDSEALLILLKANFKLGNEVRYLVVEQIENDRKLKSIFNLR